ncbi:MAG TPA: hypothetical protein VLX92_07225 [Kofleriaceae bacterium]|nr:hypothetical protein [Kofleriaceae bacterium]
MARLPVLLAVIALARGAEADDGAPPRTPDASLGDMLRGPFQSSRLFSMPTADVVGAYILSLSGDGSLLQQPGLLTSAGVIAIGFGDIMQLEYRHTEAISVTGVNAPVPAIGVQLKIPLPDRPGWPAVGVALRLGVSRQEQFGATTVDEKVTDGYLVVRERIPGVRWLTLHAGARLSYASITLGGDRSYAMGSPKQLLLPTAGIEVAMNREARLVAEVSAAPRFRWDGATDPTSTASPSIGYGVIARAGLRWAVVPAVTLDATLGYQTELASAADTDTGPRDVVRAWDIRLGAEVFVPWGALACRAFRVFCD